MEMFYGVTVVRAMHEQIGRAAYRLIITGWRGRIPVWVSGRSGAPWKAFQGLENTEEKGGKCFREGPAKTLQKYDLLDWMRSAWYNRER